MFFFKQKTAYELRIRDWSSDVCSSDLPSPERGGLGGIAAHAGDRREALVDLVHNLLRGLVALLPGLKKHDDTAVVEILRRGKTARRAADGAADRSEEHTSELQSLMRISYAVFCLKKKNIQHSRHKQLYHATQNH